MSGIEIGVFAASYAFKKAADACYSTISKSILARKRITLSDNFAENFAQTLESSANEVSAWSQHIEYVQPQDARDLTKIYVELDIFVEPITDLPANLNRKRKIKQIIRKSADHIVLLGRPGGGKTTTLKAIARDILYGNLDNSNMLLPAPIVIRLREKDPEKSLYEHIFEALNLDFFNKDGTLVEREKLSDSNIIEIVHTILNEFAFPVMVDGFDEISVAQKSRAEMQAIKSRFISDFNNLCMAVNRSLIILTSRTADFDAMPLAAHKYELSALSNRQVRKFVYKYFKNKEVSAAVYEELVGKKLLGAEFIPLTLTYMCIVYRKYGQLFNSRRELYNRIIDLMIDEWDIKRQIRRGSSFEKFDTYDKKRFLRQLSYNLTTNTWKFYFPLGTVREQFEIICQDYEGLQKRDFYSVLQEIEVHTGLFVKSGEGYMFSHRTLQEYLAATYLYEFPEVPKDVNLLIKMPNELALAASFNENASLYLSYIILNRFSELDRITDWEADFWTQLFERMEIEKPNFKVHPYMGLSALFLFSRLVSVNMRRELIEFNDRKVSMFFRFMNSDRKIEKSLERLSNFYEIKSEFPEKGLLLLAKRTRVDSIGRFSELEVDKALAYYEPSELLCPYKYFEHFSDPKIQ